MKNWFIRLLARLTDSQTRMSLSKDWRGRPMVQGAQSTLSVELAKGVRYSTLRLPSLKPSSAGLPKILPDPK